MSSKSNHKAKEVRELKEQHAKELRKFKESHEASLARIATLEKNQRRGMVSGDQSDQEEEGGE